jgi:arylsulfatase A-like enzyme
MSLRFLAILLLASPSANPLEAAERPNVIVILADDQGWGDLSVHGNTNLSTPHIDSLARDGAIFDRFYVCPVCSPTRAEFLTGRYHPRGNVWNVSTGGERLDLDERTIADSFAAGGYATAAFGKWHNGMQYPYHPNGRGFQEYYGFCSGHWGDYFSPPLEHNGQPVRGNGFIIDDLTDHALTFLNEHRDRPVFCYLALNTPHSPMQVPDSFYQKFANNELPLRYHGKEREEIDHTRAALAMCENIDWNVGRVLAKLDELKIANNTIVLYFSDNGPNGWRWNDGMRGRKGSTDEGGVRSPLLVRWPGQIATGTKIPQISAAIDLLPTLLDLTGVERVGDKPLDGVSLAPLLRGKSTEPIDRMIFSHWARKVSVRTQQYRLDAAGRLYDMVADPGQQTDIRTQQPEVAARLAKAVKDWEGTVLAEMVREERPFTVGYHEFPVTQLPARDGIPHGGVERSGKAPNCSFFTNWTTTEGRITWDVDVHTAGTYKVVADYACPAADVGSTVELFCGPHRLTTKITEAHDPPLRGQEHDRAPRGSESYVKDFKPMTLGELQLDRGPGTLTLRASEIRGKSVMEVRGLWLTLKP